MNNACVGPEASLKEAIIKPSASRNDEPRVPAKQAGDTCASAGVPRGYALVTPLAVEAPHGEVITALMSTKPKHLACPVLPVIKIKLNF
ncbi:hypothetical protein A6J66_002800 [Yersinia enterocolitica]|nr:hypothetical protein A6J66_002800 [Yersinia enterocolitica]